jgi:hypothetical protein
MLPIKSNLFYQHMHYIFTILSYTPIYICIYVDLGGLVVTVLATGPKVHGFDLDRGRWIFKGDKNPKHHFLRRGSKAVRKRTLMFRKQNTKWSFLTQVS